MPVPYDGAALGVASLAKALARLRCHRYTTIKTATAVVSVAAEGMNARTVASAKRMNSIIVMRIRKKAVLRIEKATVPTVAEATAQKFCAGVPVNKICV